MKVELAPRSLWNLRVILFRCKDPIHKFNEATLTTDSGCLYDNHVHLDNEWTTPNHHPWYQSRVVPIPDPTNAITHGSLAMRGFTVLSQRHYKLVNRSLNFKTYHLQQSKYYPKGSFHRYQSAYNQMPAHIEQSLAPQVPIYVMLVAYPSIDDGLTPISTIRHHMPDYDNYLDIDPEMYAQRRFHPSYNTTPGPERIPEVRFAFGSGTATPTDVSDEDMAPVYDDGNDQTPGKTKSKSKASGKRKAHTLASPFVLQEKIKNARRRIADEVPHTPAVRSSSFAGRAQGSRMRNIGRETRDSDNEDGVEEPEEAALTAVPVRRFPGTGFSVTVTTHMYFKNLDWSRNILHQH
jgi:hypothetical protein